MSTKLKALGLGLFAALVMSAVVVSPASAITGGHIVTDASNGHAILLGEEVEQNKFVYGEQTITCSESEFTGTTTTATFTETTITPHYKGCSANFITPAHVRMNGCAYIFTVATHPEKEHNTTHLECPVNKLVEVEVTIPFLPDCTLTIKAQTPKNGLVYTTGVSATGKHDILADITATGIHVVRDGNSTCGAATGETGQLTGTATLRAFDTAGNQVNITATTGDTHK